MGSGDDWFAIVPTVSNIQENNWIVWMPVVQEARVYRNQ